MKYEKGKKITDDCQFKKGEKYISKYGEVFEFSHIGKSGDKYFKLDGYDYMKIVTEYNSTDFYEAIEATPELPTEGLVVHKKSGAIIYRTGEESGYGFEHGDYYIRNHWTFGAFPEEWRPATPGEERKFIELLKKECERRGLCEDTKIKAHANNNIESYNNRVYRTLYTAYIAWNTNGCIFHNGKFAKPLEEENTTIDAKIKELIEWGKSKGLKVNVTFE